MLGFWANEGIVDEVVTVYEGLKINILSPTLCMRMVMIWQQMNFI